MHRGGSISGDLGLRRERQPDGGRGGGGEEGGGGARGEVRERGQRSRLRRTERDRRADGGDDHPDDGDRLRHRQQRRQRESDVEPSRRPCRDADVRGTSRVPVLRFRVPAEDGSEEGVPRVRERPRVRRLRSYRLAGQRVRRPTRVAVPVPGVGAAVLPEAVPGAAEPPAGGGVPRRRERVGLSERRESRLRPLPEGTRGLRRGPLPPEQVAHEPHLHPDSSADGLRRRTRQDRPGRVRLGRVRGKGPGGGGRRRRKRRSGNGKDRDRRGGRREREKRRVARRKLQSRSRRKANNGEIRRRRRRRSTRSDRRLSSRPKSEPQRRSTGVRQRGHGEGGQDFEISVKADCHPQDSGVEAGGEDAETGAAGSGAADLPDDRIRAEDGLPRQDLRVPGVSVRATRRRRRRGQSRRRPNGRGRHSSSPRAGRFRTADGGRRGTRLRRKTDQNPAGAAAEDDLLPGQRHSRSGDSGPAVQDVREGQEPDVGTGGGDGRVRAESADAVGADGDLFADDPHPRTGRPAPQTGRDRRERRVLRGGRLRPKTARRSAAPEQVRLVPELRHVPPEEAQRALRLQRRERRHSLPASGPENFPREPAEQRQRQLLLRIGLPDEERQAEAAGQHQVQQEVASGGRRRAVVGLAAGIGRAEAPREVEEPPRGDRRDHERAGEDQQRQQQSQQRRGQAEAERVQQQDIRERR
ncbi:UNVERIFIED_CONTAM: hypothetical protein PYX00_004445 [Menopon gallinae]|uniref:Uncharacterized protein n=1 Tax=Menopon gallinae TaxID=328185 RepID=A0AAW2I5B5_9NEOP